MPLYNIPIINANIPQNADIDISKLAFSSMGCWLYKTTVQSIPNNTLTPLTFPDAEVLDAVPSSHSGLHDPIVNPSRIILRQPGLWIVMGIVSYNGATGTGTKRYAYIRRNGATTVIATDKDVVVASTPIGVMVVGLVFTAFATEFVELGAHHTQGAALDVGEFGGGTLFGAGWLGNNS